MRWKPRPRPASSARSRNWEPEVKRDIRWRAKPEEHDYPAALSYLGLVYDDRTAAGLVRALRRAHMTRFKAKDIFRASGLSLLGISNSHVEKDRARIKK